MGALAVAVPLTGAALLGLLLNGYILLVLLLTRQVQTANHLLLLHLGVVDSLLCALFLLFAAPALLRPATAAAGGAGAAAGQAAAAAAAAAAPAAAAAAAEVDAATTAAAAAAATAAATAASAGDSAVAAEAAAAAAAAAAGGAGAVAGGPSGAPCSLHGFLFTLLHPVALWTVCGLNCDRYLAIAAPLHYAAVVSPRRAAVGLAAAWAGALLLALPPLFLVAPYRFSAGLGGCAPDFASASGWGALLYSGAYTLLTLLLPAALITGCNVRVLRIASRHRHRIASAIFEVALSAQLTITHQRNPFAGASAGPPPPPPRLRNRRAAATVLQLLGSCLLLYFPYYAVILWEAAGAARLGTAPRVPPVVATLAASLLSCSPPVNGLLYGVRSKLLRKSLRNYWRKQVSRSEVVHEIQARTPSACGSRRPSLTPLGLLGRPLDALPAPLPARAAHVLAGRTPAPSPPPRLARFASALDWRPTSSSSGAGGFMQRSRSFRDRLPGGGGGGGGVGGGHGAGGGGAGELAASAASLRSAALFVQRVLGRGLPPGAAANELMGCIPCCSRAPAGACGAAAAAAGAAAGALAMRGSPRARRPRPRILITRAASEDSDSAPPAEDAGPAHAASAAALLQRCRGDAHAPVLSSGSSSDAEAEDASGASGASGASDASSGRFYMSLEGAWRASTAPLCAGAGECVAAAKGGDGGAYGILWWPAARMRGGRGGSSAEAALGGGRLVLSRSCGDVAAAASDATDVQVEVDIEAEGDSHTATTTSGASEAPTVECML